MKRGEGSRGVVGGVREMSSVLGAVLGAVGRCVVRVAGQRVLWWVQVW